MFNLGMGEITVIVLLALIFIGPKKLPDLASGLGKLIREIRKTTSDVKNEIQLDEAIRKPFEELREAVTLHPEELKRRDRIKRELEAARRAAVEAERLIADAAALAAVDAPPVGAEAAPGEPGSSTDGAAAVSPTGEPSAAARTGLPGFAATPPTGTIPREPSSPLSSSPSSLPASLKRPLTSPTPLAAPPPASTLGLKPPTDPSRTLLGSFDASRREAAKASAASRPPLDSAADRSNTTQALTEADLAAVTGSPPPPPIAVRTGRTFPPPSPGLPGSTPPAVKPPPFGKSGPISAGPVPAAPANGSRSGPISISGAKSGPIASAPPPAADEAAEKKPEPST